MMMLSASILNFDAVQCGPAEIELTGEAFRHGLINPPPPPGIRFFFQNSSTKIPYDSYFKIC
jgi:hypothetical protein